MRKILGLLLCAAAVLTVSCERQEQPFGIGNKGKAVKFTTSVGTKTALQGYAENGVEAVLWEDGDVFTVWSEQASVAGSDQKWADYKVCASAGVATAVNPAEAGVELLWGDGMHTFYAGYPAGKLQRNKLSANIPASQKLSKIGDNVFGPALSEIGYMAATAQAQPEAGTVNLVFNTLFNVFEFIVSAGDAAEVNVTDFRLGVQEGSKVVLAGGFAANLSAQAAPEIVVDYSSTSGDIKAQLGDGSGVKLLKGQTLTVSVIALPLDLSALIAYFTVDGKEIAVPLVKKDGSPILFPAGQKARITALGVLAPETPPTPADPVGITVEINGVPVTDYDISKEPGPNSSVEFNLSANYNFDGTPNNFVKTDWEAGDAIFVFLSNAQAPKYLKMSYDGSSWSTTELNGSTPAPGSLGLAEGDTGTMRAVFLPFGSNSSVSAGASGEYVFSTTYYTYYLTASLDFEVQDNTVSGVFDMVIPEDYIQFFIEDNQAVDNAYVLGTDWVKPVGLLSIDSNLSLTETSDGNAADDLPGYAYSGGYLFSGKLSDEYENYCYYFAKIRQEDGEREDYFTNEYLKLDINKAIILPSNGSSGWTPVGPDKTVILKYTKSDGTTLDLGNWYTCNYGCSVPEEPGNTYGYGELDVQFPSYEALGAIWGWFDVPWYLSSIHGNYGWVIESDLGGVVFVPVQSWAPGSRLISTYTMYWGMGECYASLHQGFTSQYYVTSDAPGGYQFDPTAKCLARPVKP